MSQPLTTIHHTYQTQERGLCFKDFGRERGGGWGGGIKEKKKMMMKMIRETEWDRSRHQVTKREVR